MKIFGKDSWRNRAHTIVFMFSIGIIWVSFGFSPTNAQTDCAVEGRVVNENGQPVEKAFVLLDTSNALGNSDYISVGVETDKTGVFTLKSSCPEGKKQEFIYVTSPLLWSVKTLLLPPFDELGENKSQFAGRPVLLIKNEVVNLGDIKIQTHYVTVELALVDESGRPFFTNNEQWSKVWQVVKDEEGRIVVNRGMSIVNLEEHISKNGLFMRVSLPEGTWVVELIQKGEGRSFIAKKKITVSRANSPQKVNLTVSKK